MDREVPFEEKAICDRCGAKGVFDFMGDLYCQECIAEAQQSDVATGPDDDDFCEHGVIRGECLFCPPRR